MRETEIELGSDIERYWDLGRVAKEESVSFSNANI